jgi:hypothetical protein
MTKKELTALPPSGGPSSTLAPSIAATQRPRSGRRPRRRWIVALVALLAIVALVVVEVPPLVTSTPSSTPSSAHPETIWQTITAGITDGMVPRETALEAFAYLYKVDIPGVTVPKGFDGGDEPSDGSGPMTWVQANWDSLTPAQKAVINRFIDPGPNDRIIQPNSTVGTTADVAKPQFQLDRADIQPDGIYLSPIYADIAPDVPLSLANAITNELLADIAHIGPKLGMAVIQPGSAITPDISLIMSDEDGGNTLMETFAYSDNHNPYEPCRVTVYRNTWLNAQVTSSGGVSDRLHVLMTHEVVHCYQHVVEGSVAAASVMPVWITEGTAMWLAADDTGIIEPSLPNQWRYAYFVPETALTNRSYDAFGYYALLDHLGRNLWQLMLPAWQAATAATGSGTQSDAFIAVLHGDDLDVRNNWAESYLREDGWRNPWIAYGFGLPDDAKVVRHSAEAVADPGTQGSLESRSNAVLSVDSSDGEVVTISTDGLASVHDEGNDSATAFQNESFCTKDGGCVCPPGTLLAGQNMAQQNLTIPFVAAFNALEGGSKYSIVSSKLDDLCSGKSTPEPSLPGGGANLGGSGTGVASGPCGPSCSHSNGDPHMLTVNHQRYDFQAAGEFTLLQSADGSVDIQARQEPFTQNGGISLDTAIAAKVGSHRVGVYVVQSGLVSHLQAHLDGSTVDLSAGPDDLGDGGSISSYPNGFEIDFPDGTKMWTLSVGQWGINAQISPSASLRSGGSGLLGPVVPGTLGVPNLPDGTRLPATTDNQRRLATVYGQFADAWRVTDATSLFDYDSGKSTASYTIKPYPTDSTYDSIGDLSAGQRAAGNSACSAITDSDLHDDCVFDVGVSGDNGFAGSYAATQTFEQTPAAASPTPVASPSQGPGALNGAMTVMQGLAIGGYAIDPHDTLFASIQTASAAYSLISIDPTNGQILNQVSVPALTQVHFAAGSVWLPGSWPVSGGSGCSVVRYDPATLTQEAAVKIPCGAAGGPDFATDGDAIWFVDPSHYDSSKDTGLVLTRIDPATNAPGTSVPLPKGHEKLMDSTGALFYGDDSDGYYRLTVGSTTLDSLGVLTYAGSPFAGGSGLWVRTTDLTSAEYFTSAGKPSVTLAISGTLVGGDSTAAYVTVPGTDAQGAWQAQLWRYPLDGSTPTQLAVPPIVDGSYLSYSLDPSLVIGADGVATLWSTTSSSAAAEPSPILLQWAPLH